MINNRLTAYSGVLRVSSWSWQDYGSEFGLFAHANIQNDCLAHTGHVFVLSMNGALAYVDTSDCTIMNFAEHYMASDVEWDPTGRYVVTSVSWWSHKVFISV